VTFLNYVTNIKWWYFLFSSPISYNL